MKIPAQETRPPHPDRETRFVNAAYALKFEQIKEHTLFDALDIDQRSAVRKIAADNCFTLQELKRFIESQIDLSMWNGTSMTADWHRWRSESGLNGRAFKKWAFNRLEQTRRELSETEVEYVRRPRRDPSHRHRKIKILEQDGGRKIFGKCPVYSDKTLCCNLYTIDAVKNCGFGCSYCSIQTMYTDDDILIDGQFRDKLDAIELDPARRYHIGTGQSSDALMWGNTNGILDDMLGFARKWPNALVEFKTKSDNVRHLIGADVPPNIVCSWSLNPEIIVENEEHSTASLSARLSAARAVADRGIRVAFHLHPMVNYRGWRRDYSALIDNVIKTFHPDEVLFASFGALTFPKPIIRKIRSHGVNSKIHQMEMVPNPEGKMSYPDDIKIKLFGHAHEAFEPWHGKVFFYLCMEEKRFWEPSLGASYPGNEAFERSMLDAAWAKMPPRTDRAAGSSGSTTEDTESTEDLL
jgi:spore photoproduct lyase